MANNIAIQPPYGPGLENVPVRTNMELRAGDNPRTCLSPRIVSHKAATLLRETAMSIIVLLLDIQFRKVIAHYATVLHQAIQNLCITVICDIDKRAVKADITQEVKIFVKNVQMV